MPSRAQGVAATVLRMLLAVVFVVSAGAKLFAIDSFELYVFSYGWLSLNVTYVAVRLCIAAELVLGVMLALGWWARLVRLLTLLVLVLFSLFLGYAALAGRMESCQCFGQLVDFNPVESLLKNAVLIVLTLLYGRWDTHATTPRRWRPWVAALIAVGLTVSVFCISVPDSWMFRPDESYYDKELIETSVADGGALADEHLAEGHRLVAFVTPGCPYCRMAREKLSSIASRNDLDTNRIRYYEPSDLPDGLFMQITYGQRPFIVLLEDGRVKTTYHYRNISERQIVRSLHDGE